MSLALRKKVGYLVGVIGNAALGAVQSDSHAVTDDAGDDSAMPSNFDSPAPARRNSKFEAKARQIVWFLDGH